LSAAHRKLAQSEVGVNSLGALERRMTALREYRLRNFVHCRCEWLGRRRPLVDHTLESAATHDVESGFADGEYDPFDRQRIHALEHPAQLTVRLTHETVQRHLHLQHKFAHVSAPLFRGFRKVERERFRLDLVQWDSGRRMEAALSGAIRQ
jgi:hypothetical protein